MLPFLFFKTAGFNYAHTTREQAFGSLPNGGDSILGVEERPYSTEKNIFVSRRRFGKPFRKSKTTNAKKDGENSCYGSELESLCQQGRPGDLRTAEVGVFVK
jgi:hypothetical protein